VSLSSRKVVVDTNVILFDALAVSKFVKAEVYVPLSVIEEIDRFKRDPGENGRNARHFSRFVDVLRAKGKLPEGVMLEGGQTKIFVLPDKTSENIPGETFENKADNRILMTAIALSNEDPSASVELGSKDINLRIKADVFGINAKDYEPEKVSFEEMYTGHADVTVTSEQINEFYESKILPLGDDHKLFANQYLVVRDSSNENHSAIGRYDVSKKAMVPLIGMNEGIWGIHPRNVEQSFALDGLLNDEILFVSLVGKAGTGKTLLALAAGLFKTLDEGRFQRLLVSRPIFPMGRDIGYLPGDVEQKLNPWMQPIFDNVEFLMGADKKAAGRAQELMNQGMLNIEPLTYIRGRSIPNQYLIVDEAQNLTPHEIKTIVTRITLTLTVPPVA